MNRQGHEGVSLFIGPEVEHTPAYSKRTLFVVGKPKLDQIEQMARENKTPHIFMGANHSFSSESLDPYWDHVITALLDRGFWVTLDYQAHEHETVLKMLNAGIWQCRTFVPLLGVRIPKVQTSNVNLTVKIDDVDFNATNAGVWCLHHHELTDSNRYTSWQDYESDEVLSVDGNGISNASKAPSEPVMSASTTTTSLLGPDDSGETGNEVKNDAAAGLDTKPKEARGSLNKEPTIEEAVEAYVEAAPAETPVETVTVTETPVAETSVETTAAETAPVAETSVETTTEKKGKKK